MRIAYLANIRFPSERAHSSQIVHMCEAFLKNSNQIDLFVSRRSPTNTNSFIEHLGFVPNFLVYNIGPKRIYSKIKITFFFGEWWFALHFLFTGKVNNYNYLFSRSEYILWFLSFFMSPHKLVWESHDGRLNYFSRFLMRKEVCVVVTSHYQFETFSLYSKKMLLAPNSIDSSFFGNLTSKLEARKMLNLQSKERYTMYIGGLDKWKGPETFFESSNFDTCSILVVIGGKTEEVAQYKKKYPNITFLGQKPYSELIHIQQAADVLVVPNTAKNKLSREITSPLKLYAHMSSGVPVVMTDIPSLISVVSPPSVTLCEPDNPKDMAKKIASVYEEYDNKFSQAQNLRKKMSNDTWSKRANNIVTFLS